ncbi:MAG: tetratricopeptide repeat protein [Gammaproteobacteria bacterium]
MTEPEPGHRTRRDGGCISLACLLLLFGSACSRDDNNSSGFTPPTVPTAELGAAAREQLDQALAAAKASPADDDAMGAYAMLLQAYGHVDAAASIYRYLRKKDDDPRWSRYHGLILLDLGDAVAAEAAFRESDPENAEPIMTVYVARALAAGGDNQQASTILRGVVEKYPERVDALIELAAITMQDADPVVSEDLYRRALAAVPDLKPAHYGLAQALRAQGLVEQASAEMALFESASQEGYTPEDDPRRELAAMVVSDSRHVERAKRALAAGDYQRAREELEQARGLNPDNLSTLTNLIAVYGRLREPQAALNAYQSAIAINPDYYQAHFNFGVVMSYLGRPLDAERAYRLAAAADPERPEPYVEYGRMLSGAGQGTLAMEQFRRALDLDANNVAARFLLGRQLALAGDPEQAIWHLQQATLGDGPGVPGMMRALAGVYGQVGRIDDARATLESARERAAQLGQLELAEQIGNDLARLPTDRPASD